MSNLSHKSTVLFSIFCLHCNSIFFILFFFFIFFFFHHFDCQVLDDNLERKEKLSLKKKLRCHGNKTVSFIEIICGFD